MVGQLPPFCAVRIYFPIDNPELHLVFTMFHLGCSKLQWGSTRGHTLLALNLGRLLLPPLPACSSPPPSSKPSLQIPTSVSSAQLLAAVIFIYQSH